MNEPAPRDQLGREETIFNAAVQLRDPAKQAIYLDLACENDAPLRDRIEKLLASDAGDDFFAQRLSPPMQPPSAGPVGERYPPAATEPHVVSERIGRYKLLQKIGEGGCGMVYMAEQEQPVRRRVALKIIRLGMDSQSVIARFEAERQALALMDHPNIAKILDGGVTETGRPYFVMDLVQGLPLTQFCDEAQLPTRERLGLFLEVCSAIQHAHQKGIIHRDIKPSNILVTLHGEKPVPKVIDFGIAKATQQRLTDKTLFTQFQHFIGTPVYMSPEQATLSGLDIDTRSDIYSLGVLLYELLTGKTPFDSKELLQAGLEEMCRTIREKEPARPSTRLSTLAEDELTTTAKRRGLLPPKLVSLLRGDLDWIVMKCLEKDRARRYETANGLAMDLQRHLKNEPVIARPPGRLYRLQKLVRRNRLVFAALSAVTVVLLLGIAVSAWQAVRARRAEREQGRLRLEAVAEKRKAQTEAAKSRQEATLLQDMLASAGPSKALGRDATMLREILDKTVERLGKELADEPEVQLELRATIADTYHELGFYSQAEALARTNLMLAKACFGEEHAAVAQALYQLGRAQLSLGNGEQAEASHRQALALRQRLFGEENLQVAASRANLAQALDYQWKWAEAEPLYRQALKLRQKLLGPEHPEVASSLHGLGSCLLRQAQPLRMVPTTETNATSVFRRQKLAEAETCLSHSLAIKQKVLGAEHPDVASSLNDLAIVLDLQGNVAQAENYFRQAWLLHRKLTSDEHPETLIALRNLAHALKREGKAAEVEELCRHLLALKEKLLQEEHPSLDTPFIPLAVALDKQDKFAEAEELYRRGLAMRWKLLDDEHPSVTQSVELLLANLLKQGKLSDAQTAVDSILNPALQRHPGAMGLLKVRAAFFVHRGWWKEAAADFAKALALDPSDHTLYCSIIPLLAANGDLEGYHQYCDKALTRFSGTRDGPTADRVAKACLIFPCPTVTPAYELAKTAMELNTNFPGQGWSRYCQGLAEYRQGHFESAADWASQALAQADMTLEPHCLDVESDALLALCRCRLGLWEEARAAAVQCEQAIARSAPDLGKGDPGADWPDMLYGQALLKEAQALLERRTASSSP